MVYIKRFLTVSVVLGSLLSCNNTKKEGDTAPAFPVEDMQTKLKPIDSVQSTTPEPVSKAALKAQLMAKGYEVFDYVDAKTQDTILMQKYFMAFLKEGPIRNQNEEEAALLQKAHLAYLGKMYDLGYADISGPFDDDGVIRGITIYNVPTKQLADSLAQADPMVQSGRLKVEIHPWWAAKGYRLR